MNLNRTLVFGDIHGGLKALEQLLERINIIENDTLIFLGDYVDGWSESAQVIDFLMELERNYQCIFIKGNHDAWCIDWLGMKQKSNVWMLNGGKETIESYSNHSAEQVLQHLNFFDRMKDFYVDAQNRLFIHAGFSSMHGPTKEIYSSNYSWDRTLWEMAVALDERIELENVFYPKRLKLFKEIYIGHTPTTNYEIQIPLNKANVWNIDTGAAFTGKLSCLDIETKEFWQSEALPSLYPNEQGRNN